MGLGLRDAFDQLSTLPTVTSLSGNEDISSRSNQTSSGNSPTLSEPSSPYSDDENEPTFSSSDDSLPDACFCML